jgi:hypothetical protein
MISIFKCPNPSLKGNKENRIARYKYTSFYNICKKNIYQGYFLTVLELNGVLVGVKLKKGLGAGSFDFDERCVAGGLKF